MRSAGIFTLLLAAIATVLPAPAADDAARWKQEAAQVQIVRDDWGIAHVHGKTDAEAVFGMIYAQAEDDFNRVETNYLTALGLTSEAEGEKAIWQDLRQKLFVDPEVLKADYAESPEWLKALTNAWADGLNYYLATHPDVKPKVITHFEPWMALSFTEGSIGGDIERVKLTPLEDFYGKQKLGMTDDERGFVFHEPRGSNGIAIAPSDTKDGHALLLINPHTTFFFRSELQMSSDEGLDAYGAVTWGQFFVYQGFNQNVGWMHTSTGADNVDEFAETVTKNDGKFYYRYGDELRPVGVKIVKVPYRTPDGRIEVKTFTTYYTSHGPIVREENGKWISMALMNTPIPALEQSYLRTKTSDYASYMKVAEFKANSSNNTIFADGKGEIAFLLPQFMPKRDNRFDYTKPVDGADPATDWHGLTPLDELPQAVNPPNGWVFNTNDWPYSAAGPYSPKRRDFPKYMDTFGENPRGIHATEMLINRKDFTLESLLAAAFDPYLPAFARLIPALVKAYDATPSGDPLKSKLKDQIALLRGWDYKWSDHSLATSLAVFWGDTLWDETIRDAKAAGIDPYSYMADHATAAEKLKALAEASDRLQKDFGNWRTPWGWINRFQRVDDQIAPHFDDGKPSIAVPFVSSRWGSLASFGAKRYPNTKRYYGTAGNSFVAVVEFGPKVRAVAVTAGGESGDPNSPHFDDEAIRYARGELRPVYFYPDDLKGHIERSYHPGE
ncbi:MAG: penicillin acylase family protein [Alphaproteobacteria bacterium]|nr:penicillin acylase family protein [Alphaproteobacteria bacterium]MDE2111854.1 penicillin acylase family protein [Alphaproteobacteria bacterium]MDE2493594.1 penicillin acylase family protein [Alphaproteobacteria bacterium]